MQLFLLIFFKSTEIFLVLKKKILMLHRVLNILRPIEMTRIYCKTIPYKDLKTGSFMYKLSTKTGKKERKWVNYLNYILGFIFSSFYCLKYCVVPVFHPVGAF